MLTTHAKTKPDPDVISTTLRNGETVLLHLRTQTYYSLNETGSHIWQLISDGLTLGEVSRALGDQFDVTPERAESSVLELTHLMTDEELVSVIEE